jgi:hypothetical protein
LVSKDCDSPNERMQLTGPARQVNAVVRRQRATAVRSFQLHVGERRRLSGAGYACLLVAIAVTGVVGYLFARPLADALGLGRLAIAVVAGSGAAAWGLGGVAFRAAGFPLVVESPPDAEQDAEPGATPDRRGM